MAEGTGVPQREAKLPRQKNRAGLCGQASRVNHQSPPRCGQTLAPVCLQSEGRAPRLCGDRRTRGECEFLVRRGSFLSVSLLQQSFNSHQREHKQLGVFFLILLILAVPESLYQLFTNFSPRHTFLDKIVLTDELRPEIAYFFFFKQTKQ